MNRDDGKRTELPKQRIVWIVAVSLVIAIVIVVMALISFRSRVYKREYESQIARMQDVAFQSGEVLDERLIGYLHTMSSLAELFQQGELHTEENLERLERIASENDMDFHNLGIADTKGYSWTLSGGRLDISEREYFKRAVAGENVVSRSFESNVTGAQVFAVAVPIRDAGENIRGVLYGTVDVEEFPLFQDEKLQSLSRYIRVIDSNGNYIVRGQDEQGILQEENFYDGMKRFDMEISVEELEQRMQDGEEVFLICRAGSEKYILCIAPLFFGKWNMVLIMKETYIDARVSYLLGDDVYWLMLKSIVVFALVCGIIIWYLHNEKKCIMNLYSQKQLQERMIRKAVAAIDSVILFYDAKQDTLKILSDSQNRLKLPPEISRASRRLTEYLPVSKKEGEELLHVMSRLHGMEDIESFELPLEMEGIKRRFLVRVERVAGEAQRIFHYVGIVEDITEKNSLEQEVKLQQELFSSMVGFMVADLDKDKIMRSSEKLQELYESGAAYSMAVKEIIEKKVILQYREQLKEMLSPNVLLQNFECGERGTKAEFSYWDSEKEMRWMECEIRVGPSRENGHCLVYITLQDISEQKNTEQILKEKAERDDLTGLYNRRKTVEMVDRLLTKQEAEDMTNAFVLLDMDNFKELNDTLGHQTGDRALTEVAQILNHHFREYDLVCRLGGDEFVVFIKQIPREIISRNIEALLKRLILTYVQDEKTVTVSASAGIAVTPEHGMDFETLYRKADEALYDVKKSRKGTYKIYGGQEQPLE